MVKYTLILCVFCFVNLGIAQGFNSNWHFGKYAALHFGGGAPVPIGGSSLFTQEGSSTMSDINGDLLFYTDGMSVWDKNNNQMPNGFGLMGNPSTTQAALIIPMPGNSTKYYLFAIDQLGGAMTYSIVDMNLNGGFGDVVASSKNILLHTAVCEKQCGYRICDGNIWILSHEFGSNTFFADLITPSGINPSVTSSVGIPVTTVSNQNLNATGQMKISPLGNKIALALRDIATFELYDFDINTGKVSNAKTLCLGCYPIANGVEFSPDGSKLYGSVYGTKQVVQFDVSLVTQAEIAGSATTVGYTSTNACNMQVGEDGKVYVAQCISQQGLGTNSLCVINSPNLLGASSNFAQNGLSLGSQESLVGLPNFMVIPEDTLYNYQTLTICSGDSIKIGASVSSSSHQWMYGSNATTDSIFVSPTVNSVFVVKSDYNCSILTDSITIIVTPKPTVSVNHYQTICLGDTVKIGASIPSSSHQWVYGINATTDSIFVSPTGNSVYVVESDFNCSTIRDSISVFVNPKPTVSAGNNQTICIGDTIVLTESGNAVSYTWNNGVQSNVPFVPNSGLTTFILQGEDANGCVNYDSVTVLCLFPNASFTASPQNGSAPLNIFFTNTSTGATNFSWDFGNGQSVANVGFGNYSQIYTSPGTYIVILTAENNGCIDSASAVIHVSENNALSYQIPNIITPNGDGVNDVFHLNLVNASALELIIYNRWGNWLQTITNTDNAKGWNGKTSKGEDVVDGTYFYTYKITDYYNQTIEGHGFVQVQR